MDACSQVQGVKFRREKVLEPLGDGLDGGAGRQEAPEGGCRIRIVPHRGDIGTLLNGEANFLEGIFKRLVFGEGEGAGRTGRRWGQHAAYRL